MREGKNNKEKISTEIGNLATTKDGACSGKLYLGSFAYMVQGGSKRDDR